MKKIFVVAMAAALTSFMSLTSFAGTWYQAEHGYSNYDYEYVAEWRYRNDNGTDVENAWIGNYYVGEGGWMYEGRVTPDGYYVDGTGVWVPSMGKVVEEYYLGHGTAYEFSNGMAVYERFGNEFCLNPWPFYPQEIEEDDDGNRCIDTMFGTCILED